MRVVTVSVELALDHRLLNLVWSERDDCVSVSQNGRAALVSCNNDEEEFVGYTFAAIHGLVDDLSETAQGER